MKNHIILLSLLGGLSFTGFAQDNKVLQKIDEQVNFGDSDFSAEYTLTETVPGQGVSEKTFYILRRDKDNKYTLLLTAPKSEKGKGYLKIGNNMWVYDPANRKFIVTSARDRFQNSNARNSDFTQSSLTKDYKIDSMKPETIEGIELTAYSLSAVTDSVSYPRMMIWVSKDNLVYKYQNFSLSGTLMRTTIVSNYNKLKSRFIPEKITIIDETSGKKLGSETKYTTNTLVIKKPSLANLPDRVFTQAYLEQISK